MNIRIREIPPLADLPETQALLGNIGRSVVFDLIKSGRLQAVKFGRATKITGPSIAQLISELPALSEETKVRTDRATARSLATRAAREPANA